MSSPHFYLAHMHTRRSTRIKVSVCNSKQDNSIALVLSLSISVDLEQSSSRSIRFATFLFHLYSIRRQPDRNVCVRVIFINM
jgi:hypothetical protein